VISKIFFVDFLDELRLFIGERPIFMKKKFRHPAVCRLRSAVCRDFMALFKRKNLFARFLKDAFKLETSELKK
jgi:hypothetical protein